MPLTLSRQVRWASAPRARGAGGAVRPNRLLASRAGLFEQGEEVLALDAFPLGLRQERHLGEQPDRLRERQVVEARGLDLAEAWVAVRSSRQMVLRQSVEDGLVTQAQADWIAGVLAEPPECPRSSP